MAKLNNRGMCLLCNQEITHRSIKKHLAQCIEKTTTLDPKKIFLIKIRAGKIFWLYVEINGNASLETLDAFLRTTWLECCHHMSQFTIHAKDYSCDGDMKKTIQQVFDLGTPFDYEYDFGDTTTLQGEVIGVRSGKLKQRIRLVARNCFPDDIVCRHCQKKPQSICSICYELFCEACMPYHANCDGVEYMLPVVNSPRMGVCGYTGSEE